MLVRARLGFTLIELLVVISIIALLIAILLPALKRASESAEVVQCAVDQRSLGQASVSFAVDNDSLLPDLGNAPGVSTGVPTGDARPYFVQAIWKQELGAYGAIRSNWYSVSNDAWNNDTFYRPGSFNGSIIIGRFSITGDRGAKFADTVMKNTANSGYVADKQMFAYRMEDNVVFDLMWMDLNRMWPSGQRKFQTQTGNPDVDSIRQGANHISDDPAVALGTHLTKLDGSTSFRSFSDMVNRGRDPGNALIWW